MAILYYTESKYISKCVLHNPKGVCDTACEECQRWRIPNLTKRNISIQSDNERIAKECYLVGSRHKMSEVIDAIKSALDAKDAEIAKLKHDIDAYRGALGYSVPDDHNGRLSNGEAPLNVIVDYVARERDLLAIKVVAARKVIANHTDCAGDQGEWSEDAREFLATSKSPAVLEVEGKLDFLSYFERISKEMADELGLKGHEWLPDEVIIHLEQVVKSNKPKLEAGRLCAEALRHVKDNWQPRCAHSADWPCPVDWALASAKAVRVV